MIGYHYSPATNHTSITKHGLLVPLKHPKLTTPVVCSQGHRNPHISLGKTPADAWELSGGFLARRDVNRIGEHRLWNLYQVDLAPIRYRSNGYELQVRTDIPRARITYIGSRRVE
ncbi:MAG: hypothetical protein K2X00_24065 [Nitrospiraceae bacterium]|nr:hypothetical protein [Nitrospiraceae bacterium]